MHCLAYSLYQEIVVELNTCDLPVCRGSMPQDIVSFIHPKGNVLSFPWSFVAQLVEESACSAGDPGSIPGLGRSPGEGNGNPLQYPCLENLMDRGAWWAAVHGVAKSRAQLSD